MRTEGLALAAASLAAAVWCAGASGARLLDAPVDARSVVSNWPATPKKAALALLEKYGEPDKTSNQRLLWMGRPPWARVAIYRSVGANAFGVARSDLVENMVRYHVPRDKAAALKRFDKRLWADARGGLLAAFGESEQDNMLTLNLASEIAAGRRSVASAVNYRRLARLKAMAGKTSDYARRLRLVPAPKPRAARPKQVDTGLEPEAWHPDAPARSAPPKLDIDPLAPSSRY